MVTCESCLLLIPAVLRGGVVVAWLLQRPMGRIPNGLFAKRGDDRVAETKHVS